MNQKIILIGNPVAGGGSVNKLNQAANMLAEKGFDVDLMFTRKKGDAEEFAEGIASSAGHNNKVETLVIAAGGDGTYNEVANGLVHSGVPMAILPLGTTSVLARELGIPRDLGEAVSIAVSGERRMVHIGKIAPIDQSVKERYFLLMAGIGFDGDAVFGVSETIKKVTGKGAYVLNGLKTLLKYNPSALTISARMPVNSGRPVVLTGYAAIISNVARYGGDFRVAPEARLADPFFYVFITHRKGRLDLIRYVTGIVRGRHLGYSDISYLKTDSLEISGHAHIQLDGDYYGTSPVRIDIVPDALRLVCVKQI